MSGPWRIRITPTAEAQIAAITDLRVRRLIAERIDRLAENPHEQGKPLTGDLAGYRSVRAVGQRYRIIYTIIGDRITVFVVAVAIRREGSRTDVYALARHLFRQGLLAPSEPDAATQDKPQTKGEPRGRSG